MRVNVLLLFLLLLAVPSLAFAEPVPMCGELGQSIEAPPPIYPVREATLGQVPCARQSLTSFFIDADTPLPSPGDDGRTTKQPLGYLTAEYFPQVRSLRLPVPAAEAGSPPQGVRRLIERPPRDPQATLG